MDWYVPLTVLPAVALIILSTSNFLIELNKEIDQLERIQNFSNWVIDQKISQLRRLGYANTLLYLSAILFMFSSLIMVISHKEFLLTLMMIIAVFLFTSALVLLFIHSLKAVKIRHKHLKK